MQPYLLHQLLEETALKHPERPAVIQGETHLAYAELDTLSNQLAATLVDLGVVPGDRVGILLNKSPEAVVAIYGILKAGGIYVPLDHLAPAGRLALIIDRCDISVLVASAALAAKILEEPVAASRLRGLILAPGGDFATEERDCRMWEAVLTAPSTPPAKGFMADICPAYILHTSGSTGVPKGVVISHSNSLTFVRMAADFFAISPEDRLASHAPFHFDLSVFDLFTAANNGAAVVLLPETLAIFPSRLAEFVERAGITVWNSVATVIALLAEHGRLEQCTFDALRLVLFSGDILSPKHLRYTMERMPKALFYNLYGQTEANSSTFYRVKAPPKDDRWKIPIGRPFPNFEVFVLDEQGALLREPGQVGELYVGGGTVALGYWRDPDKTEASFVESSLHPWPGRLYRTGDLVTLDERGELIFMGRCDRQIKSRGYRIQIDEIELALASHSQVQTAAAVDIPDELLGARIFGFVQCAEEVSETDLLDYCSCCLPPYMVPERITIIESFPRTSTGKIDRRSLRQTATAEGGVHFSG